MKISRLTKKVFYTSLCGCVALYVYADAPKSLNSAVNANWAVLGAPTFEATAMPTSSTICINTSNVTLGTNPVGGLNFGSTVTKDELNLALNLGLGLELPFLESYGVSFNPNANFAASAVNSQYTFNYTYLYTYSTDAKLNTVYGDANLNANGANALRAGQSAFLNTCGDSFVSTLNAGVTLAVNVAVTLQNKEQAASFKESGDLILGNSSLATISQSISAMESTIGQSAVMTVSVLQNGGTPESLSTLLNYSGNNDGGFFSKPCQVGNVTNCQNLIAAIGAYSATLPSQIKNGNKLIESNLFFSSPTLQPYSSIGVSVPAPQPLSSAVKAAQAAVVEQINLSQQRINFLQNYTHSGLKLSPDVGNFIEAQTKRLQARLDYIANTSVDCFNANANNCPAIVQSIRERISTSQMYAFDKTRYGYLNSAIQYFYNGASTIIVPTSFYGEYNTLAGGYPNQTGLSATVYRTPSMVGPITEIDIPDKDFFLFKSMNKCFPLSNADGAAISRTFSCTDGLFNKFNLQFQIIDTPL